MRRPAPPAPAAATACPPAPRARAAAPPARRSRRASDDPERDEHEQRPASTGHRNVMRRPARRRLRSVAMPHDRAHEVVVGRERRRRPRPHDRSAASSSASRATCRGREPLAEPRSPVSTSSCSPGLGVLDDDEPDVRQLRSRGSTSRTASSSWRWSRRWRWRSQPGVADEVGHDHDERAAPDRPDARLEQLGEVRRRRVRRSIGWRSSSSTRRRTAAARTRPGSSARPSPPYTIAPIRLPRRVSTRASVVDEVDEHRPLEPAVGDRPEVHRRAEVEQEPGRDLAVLVVLADVRRRQCAR